MPFYEYYCINKKCDNLDKIIEIQKDFDKSDKKEKCKKCKKVMTKYIGGSLHISTGKLTYKTEKVDRPKGDESTKMYYDYRCVNKKCENFDNVIEIYKKISQASRKEKCKKCKKQMDRIFSMLGFTWGKDTKRPDSDWRKDKMIEAVDKGDMDTVSNLNKM